MATSWSTTPTNYATTTGNGPYTVPGLVPVQALQLPQDFMLDAWGNKIVYVFTKVLAGTNFGTCGYGNSGPFKLEQTNMGLVNVQNASGQLSTNQAAYVLFSAGANGLGAFQASGSGRNPTPTNANELINYNAVSSTSIYLQMTQTVDPGFDDIVRYKMKWQLVKEAGGVISNAACTTAAQVMVETPDYLVNSINYPPFCRNSPGSPFCATYLYNIANYMYGICLNKY